MSIEFRCGHCGKLLRTGDETVGREAQCPECGSITQVPDAGPIPPQPNAPNPSGNPFVAGFNAVGPQPYFVPPVQRVAGPATALIVTGVLGIIGQVLGLLGFLIQMGIGAGAAHGEDRIPFLFIAGVNVIFTVIGLAVSVVVIVGAMKMKNLEHYAFAMAASILAVIPCTSPCCLLGIPFGIWALVVLNDSSVKAAFRN